MPTTLSSIKTTGKKHVTFNIMEEVFNNTTSSDKTMKTATLWELILNRKYGDYIVWRVVVGRHPQIECEEGLSDLEDQYVSNCIAETEHWYHDLLY